MNLRYEIVYLEALFYLYYGIILIYAKAREK